MSDAIYFLALHSPFASEDPLISKQVYYILHFAGLALLVGTVGGIAFAKRDSAGKPAKPLMILHGIGSVVMLVAGFGLAARTGAKIELGTTWLMLKIGVWLTLSVLPVLMRRVSALRGVVGMVIVTAGLTLVAWALQYRP